MIKSYYKYNLYRVSNIYTPAGNNTKAGEQKTVLDHFITINILPADIFHIILYYWIDSLK